jgi:hypothetical protein
VTYRTGRRAPALIVAQPPYIGGADLRRAQAVRNAAERRAARERARIQFLRKLAA